MKPAVGPYTKDDARLIADKRSAPARRYRQLVKSLSEDPHLTHPLTPAQTLLIQRTAMLVTRMDFLDKKIIANKEFTEHDNNQYLAWNNAVRRNLDRLEAIKLNTLGY